MYRLKDKKDKKLNIHSCRSTQVSYGYVVIDNQACTALEYQAVTDVFGICQRHPILVNEHPPFKRFASPIRVQTERARRDEFGTLSFSERLIVIATKYKQRKRA